MNVQHLRSDYGMTAEESVHLVLGPLMGVLVRLARPVVNHHLGDHYYDALWLQKHITKPCVFYYGVRDMGTDIGMDRILVAAYNDFAYSISLLWNKGNWDVSVIQIKGGCNES